MDFDPEKYARAAVVQRRDLGDDLWVIRIRPEIDLPFRPGQYVTLGLAVNGRIIERPYSIVSAPDEDALELFIERVPDGELSAPLYELGVGGDVVVRKRCKGLFLKEAPLADVPHLLVSTVTGVAPFVSLLRSLRRRQSTGEWTATPIFVLQGASHAYEFGYAEELSAMAEACEWLTYIPTISRPWDDPSWSGETGRIPDILRKYADMADIGPGHGGVFLCGHPGMIQDGRSILQRRGLDNKAIREEQYWPD